MKDEKSMLKVGSPPHVRGIEEISTGVVCADRITPACAGNSGKKPSELERYKDHPRMCGE